jgi:hypothetical protein
VVVDPVRQFASPYLAMGNNPIGYYDEDGRFVFTAAILIGAAIGGYSGYKIGKAKGAKGWGMFGYIAGGAVIGGVSGAVGASIAAGGSTMAYTSAIMISSFTNSSGMYLLSQGMTDVSMNFGIADFNLFEGKVNFSDFSGEWYEDANTVLAYATFASDLLNVENTDRKQALKNSKDKTGGKSKTQITNEMIQKRKEGNFITNWINDGSNYFGNSPDNVSPKYLVTLGYKRLGLDGVKIYGGYLHDVDFYNIGANGMKSAFLNPNTLIANSKLIGGLTQKLFINLSLGNRFRAFAAHLFFDAAIISNVYIQYNYLPPMLKEN